MGVRVREKVKGSGIYWVFINHKGKRRSKKIGDKKTANSVASGIREKLNRGDLGILKQKCPTVATYGREWLTSPLKDWEETTLRNYETIFRLHIKPHLGSSHVDEVRRKHVRTLIAQLKSKGLSSSSAQVVIAVLSGIFDSAVEDELISVNPCQKTRKFCGNETQTVINPLTPDEVQTFLENASALPIEYYTFYLLAVRTGLRLGEVLALEWSDIDFDARTVEVNKSYSYRTKKIRLPKNKKPRKVDLTHFTVGALRNLKAQKKIRSITGSDLIIANNKGQPVPARTLQQTLKKVAPRPIRIHDLRHTYATLRIAKGDNILDVSKQLGHHKVAFTLDKYAHWMPGQHKTQVDELDTLHLAAPHTHPEG